MIRMGIAEPAFIITAATGLPVWRAIVLRGRRGLRRRGLESVENDISHDSVWPSGGVAEDAIHRLADETGAEVFPAEINCRPAAKLDAVEFAAPCCRRTLRRRAQAR